MNHFATKSTTLNEWLMHALAHGQDLIESSAVNHVPFPATVVFGRAGSPMMMVGLFGTDMDPEDEIRAAVIAGCMSLDNDFVTIMVDTWAALVPINPATGRHWQRGELEQFINNDPTVIERGIATESLAVLVANRAGDTLTAIKNYRRPDETTIEWDDDLSVPMRDVEGLLAQSVSRAMLAETFAHHHAKEHTDEEMPPRQLMDMYMANYLKTSLNGVVLVAAPEPD